ncbi:hypothetical protein TVAG_014970 [Trichomonas vaginalis G3]|uniref:Shwachman-Bodian-Diamond syndrome protein n=1 Tax=Trichomonas vaginalis (strain ATCC PRA-98 / G3) TaxID=412133 RepID=A2FG66_TRIV3|nr:mature ribosome assembly [Trichomonas vaginalis G3]EAX96105.1 hypothetical protein TVAG_014970 [Trichomonas vaginalis G3]KAI5500077.1 mature ribosome assembly [Trichomonas vaginalis G3]|eukprot:XP_001309035.1 hypothetical protein [Trichomonas vaginalis G3]
MADIIIPVGQKLLSNVSIVKLKKNGKQFEIAVTPNKVTSWRNGLEKDIDEVVQSHSIFSNVDRGMLAKQSEVLETLEVDDMEKALRLILDQGKLKLAEKERKLVIENLTKDIASIVASQCVNVNTERPLTPSTVERAMKEIGFSVKPTKPAKTQALKVIRDLKAAHYPTARAKIRLVFYITPEHAEKMISMLPLVEKVDKSDLNQTAVIAQVEPGSLRQVVKELAEQFGADIKIDILELYVSPTMEASEKKQDETGDKKQENDSDEEENNE